VTSKAFVAALVARGGTVVGAQDGRLVSTMDIATGAERRWKLPEDANGLTWSPDGSLLLATTLSGVATLDASGDVVARADTEGPIAWAASTNDGFVVAIDRHDEDGPTLYAWRGSPLVPVGEPTPLGDLEVEGLDVHAASSSALLWGVFGEDGAGTPGEPFVSVIALDDEPRVEWSGGGLPIDPVQWWFRADGGLVGTDGHRVASIDRSALANDGRIDAAVTAVDDFDEAGLSPDGSIVAFAHRSGGTLRVHSVVLATGERRDHGTVGEAVTPDVVAVGDDGAVTVAAATDSKTVEVWHGAAELTSIGTLRPTS
jgi:hypothetical protein